MTRGKVAWSGPPDNQLTCWHAETDTLPWVRAAVSGAADRLDAILTVGVWSALGETPRVTVDLAAAVGPEPGLLRAVAMRGRIVLPIPRARPAVPCVRAVPRSRPPVWQPAGLVAAVLVLVAALAGPALVPVNLAERSVTAQRALEAERIIAAGNVTCRLAPPTPIVWEIPAPTRTGRPRC